MHIHSTISSVLTYIHIVLLYQTHATAGAVINAWSENILAVHFIDLDDIYNVNGLQKLNNNFQISFSYLKFAY